MRILVTGSAGFIGYHLCKELLERGDAVTGIDNFNAYYDPSLKETRSALLKKNGGEFTLIRGDVCDRRTVEKAMRGIDIVVHLAAIAGVRHSLERPEEYMKSNVQGTFEVLNAARRSGAQGFIYASSSSVYGANEKLPSCEDDRVDHQLSLYGLNKRENELLAGVTHELYGIHVTGLRFFTVYGPYGRPDMALFLFTKNILQGKPIQIFGEGKMQRDWTYIDDIVAGIVSAIDKNYPNEVINLGCGKQEELMDFVALIEQCCGKEAVKEFLPMQQGDVHASLADITKARKLLGYEPKTSIAGGVPRFVEWYRGHYGV